MSGMPTHGLDVEFPMMWASSKAVDDADRAGQHSLVGPLHREIEAAMRELWMARESLAATVETLQDTDALSDLCDALREERDRAESRVRQLEEALRRIQEWDCLNPPRADLLADLPWLGALVDAALEKGKP